MDELISTIKNHINLSAEAEKYLRSIAHTKTYPKGKVLIWQEQAVEKIYYVRDGCLRSFLIDKSGKEHTLLFAIRNWWISDYIAIHNDEPANLTLECLSQSTIIEFNAKKLNGVLGKYPEYEPFQRKLLEQHMVSLQIRILDQLRLSATQRYEQFLDKYGSVEDYAANFQIASYLGITPESLSRIRLKIGKI